MEGEIPCNRRVTQSVVALKDARIKENVVKQEQWWMELTEGCNSSTASASLGAPPEMTTTSTVTSTVSSVGSQDTETATISSTTEGDTVELEVAMLSQGDKDDDMYGKKYRTMPEDRTERSAP